VEHKPLTNAHDIERLRALIQRHFDMTGSARAAAIISEWDRYLPMFWRIEPRLAASGVSSTTRTPSPRAPARASASLSTSTTPLAP
jgi:glutamate synthase domain-containing protein 3